MTSLGRLWEMELMPLAPRLTARLLMIVGTEDTLSRTEDIREFYAQVQTEKLFEEYPGSHYQILLGEGYRKLIARTTNHRREHGRHSGPLAPHRFPRGEPGYRLQGLGMDLPSRPGYTNVLAATI